MDTDAGTDTDTDVEMNVAAVAEAELAASTPMEATEEPRPAGPPPAVYLLETVDGTERTYVGATLNLDRRLRQHNGEIKGGASATSGRAWQRVCHVTGFTYWRSALQFEWRWKYYGRKYEKSAGTPMERRLRALWRLMNDVVWRNNGLQIIWEDDAARALWDICSVVRE
jgi:structure-specific endonuclease subunit SLX1